MEKTDERMNAQEAAKIYKKLMNGNVYQHFKGNRYQVLDIGVHSESAELMVCYVDVLDSRQVWIRPLYMFLSLVDRTKYPDVEQLYRFEETADSKKMRQNK